MPKVVSEEINNRERLPAEDKPRQHRSAQKRPKDRAPLEEGNARIDVIHIRPSLLEPAYSFRDPEAVYQFLEQNKYLVSLLLEARSAISHYFPDVPVFLEVSNDPEATDDGEQLEAAIAVSASPDDVHEQLNRFDHDWWAGALRRAKGKLCINVEFE